MGADFFGYHATLLRLTKINNQPAEIQIRFRVNAVISGFTGA